MSRPDGQTKARLLIIAVACLVVVVAVAWTLYSFMQAEPVVKTTGPLALTSADFQREISSGVYLVDFWAEWCGPCKAQDPIIQDIAKDFSGTVTVAKVDVDENVDLAQRFAVSAIPTLIIFKDGELNKRLVGVQNKETLKAALNAAM